MGQHTLNRFLDAQERDYATALAEIKHGRKRSHWMWYIFPQLQGLGFSATSRYYAIRDLEEARQYLGHPVLGSRLVEISRELLNLGTDDPTAIFGAPDDLKLRSCMTLFSLVPETDPVFQAVLDKFFGRKPDNKTKQLIGE